MKKITILILCFHISLIVKLSAQNLGVDYFGDYRSPENDMVLGIKSNNVFTIDSMINDNGTIKSFHITNGKYFMVNDTLTIVSKDSDTIGKFLVLPFLALKPLYDYSPITSNWFLLELKLSNKGRLLGTGKWLDNKKFGTWTYSDVKYDDIKKINKTKLKYLKINKLPKHN